MKAVCDIELSPFRLAPASGNGPLLANETESTIELGPPRRILARSMWVKGLWVAWGALGEPAGEAWRFRSRDDAEDFAAVMSDNPDDADFLAALALWSDIDLGLLAFWYREGGMPGVLSWLLGHRKDMKKAIELTELRIAAA